MLAAKEAAETLGQIGGDDVLHFLISLLELDDPRIRNHAALALEQISDDRAIEPLLKAIFKQENHNCNGTVVFALQALNCSKYLVSIVRILLFETFESKMSAYTILTTQKFNASNEEIAEIELMWNKCRNSPECCVGYDDPRIREMMEDAMQNYILKDVTKNLSR